MTNLQIAKLGKILNLMKPSMEVNMDIYFHNASKKTAMEVMKGMPKSFRRTTRVTNSGNNWKEAVKQNVCGLGKIEITVFYPKERRKVE